jgi:hypothetical protein
MNDLETLAFIAAPSVVILFGLILILISQITVPDPYESMTTARHVMHVDETTRDVLEGIVEDLEMYSQVGRRGRYSAVRNVRVADDWMPYIGDRLVTVLTQSTAEFLFVRQPKNQLTDPYQRAQWATQFATIG